jgi:hypothetical protein
MSASNDMHTTQQIANAAEAFVQALGTLFPGDTFDQFFHGDTLRGAYWTALEHTIKRHATPQNEPLMRGLLDGHMLAEADIVEELLKLFLPGPRPDYSGIAARWADMLELTSEGVPRIEQEAERFFNLLADELRRSADLRRVLYHIAHARHIEIDDLDDAASTKEQDLRRLLEAAIITGPSTLTLQVRHLMTLTAWNNPTPAASEAHALVSLANLAAHLPADDLTDVWERVERLADPALRVKLLGKLAPQLSQLGIAQDPLGLVQTAILNSDTRLDPVLIVDVLLELAPYLDALSRDHTLPPFRQRVMDGVRAINDPASRVRALDALIENLPPQRQPEAVTWAFEAASEISNDMARAMSLSDLPPSLPPEFHVRLLSLAYEIETPDARALLMGRMIPHISADLQPQALTGALHAIDQIVGDEARTSALIQLAPFIESMGPLRYLPDGLHDTLNVMFSIEAKGDRARAFAALAPYLSPELLREALHVLRDIGDDHERTTALTRLAHHLPDDLQVAAFAVAQEIQGASTRARALSAIAPYLSLNARTQALADALAAALAIEGRFERILALIDLAPHLPEDLQWRALQEALTATRSLRDENERSRALVVLAPHLAQEQMADAVADAYTILEPLERVPALSALLPYLPDEPRFRVAQDVINLARAVKPAHHKASILAAIAPVLPDELIGQAVSVADYINTPYDQMHVLAALLPRQPDQLYDLALATARAVPNRYQRVNALLELAPHIPPGLRYHLLDEALDEALGIPDDYDRASALAQLAPYIDVQTDVQNQHQDALNLALDACLDADSPETRAALLARIAKVWAELLNPAQSYSLWRRLVAFLRTRPYSEVLADLAALAPVLTMMGSQTAADTLADVLARAVFED